MLVGTIDWRQQDIDRNKGVGYKYYRTVNIPLMVSIKYTKCDVRTIRNAESCHQEIKMVLLKNKINTIFSYTSLWIHRVTNQCATLLSKYHWTFAKEIRVFHLAPYSVSSKQICTSNNLINVNKKYLKM